MLRANSSASIGVNVATFSQEVSLVQSDVAGGKGGAPLRRPAWSAHSSSTASLTDSTWVVGTLGRMFGSLASG